MIQGVLFLFFFLCSCVFVRWDYFKDQKATNIRFQPPPAGYVPVSKKEMDAAWQHPATGSTISFFSTCLKHEPQTTLPQFEKEILSDFKEFKTNRALSVSHQGLVARRLHLKSLLSQKEHQQMELLLFKKADCFYVLVFFQAGGQAPFALKDFESFVAGFEVL